MLAGDGDALERKITAVFKSFDSSNDDTVDTKAIGNIMYLLGCVPTQKEIKQFTAGIKDENMDSVHLETFLPAMTAALLQQRFPPFPEKALLHAFQTLDKEEKGYLDAEELTEFLTKRGEALSGDEMTMMLTAFADNEENRVYYKDVLDLFDVDV